MTDTVAQDLLQSFVRRIEALEDEIGALNGDKSEVYKEAKGNGFDVKVLRKVIADRRKDASERNEFDEVYQLYWDAIHGVVRAHVEKIEEFRLLKSEQLDGGREKPVSGQAAEAIKLGMVDPSVGQTPTNYEPEAAMLPQTVTATMPVVSVSAGQASVESPATSSQGVTTAARYPAGHGMLATSSAGTEGEADRQPITDLTQPNPICRDPGDCGVYASWHHPCLACKRAANVRAAA